MFLNIAYITKVNVASLNGGEGSGGNVTVMKKISNANGDEFAYVSGQALRRYLKETLMQLEEKISSVDEKGNPTFLDKDKNGKETFLDLNKKIDADILNKMYKSVCDLDLFGYMLPQGGRRWSPVKVSPLVSLLPYKGEYDYLTRKQKMEDESKKSGNIVQVEIDTKNFMRGNIMINTSHIGNEINEYTYESKAILDDKEKNKRLNVLLDAIKSFNGGAKQARNLEDIAPKFIIISKQKTGNPFLLNALSVDNNDNINIENIKEALADNTTEQYTIGIAKGIFANEQEIRDIFPNVVTVAQAIEMYKNCIEA
ncbi:type I-B CRISPR-associated protein Cas7/Cst2/DevR [Arcobacter defluvii]|uniref:CRISPR/Cas system-associated RAMP protein Cas7, type I-B n=1 Tax=Arcobacter defluvii TaxID=873191 RepID=A0AAE7BHP7_9BACT|nr:type I-B CRISPR-associated protein Cas7/Cst2/DevR [Arcobacter defluvii]QKF77957.1 CRISPR/Cas system-associated RAMP protein Cas7, type I-B [Arcobacter defluvii]RXI32735.1 type I-B CRISPR-associated protein Cas7/Cst2/DevR [Arcobacter defluvii]